MLIGSDGKPLRAAPKKKAKPKVKPAKSAIPARRPQGEPGVGRNRVHWQDKKTHTIPLSTHQANEKQRVAVKRQPLNGDAPQTRKADLARANAYNAAHPVRVNRPTPKPRVAIKGKPKQESVIPGGIFGKAVHSVEHAAKGIGLHGEHAALYGLEKLGRPGAAVSGALVEDVKNVQQHGLGHYLVHGSDKAARKAALKGITGKEHKSSTDVLAQAGWKPKGTLGKVARFGVGLVGDAATDPTTPLTFGAATPAKLAAEEASRSVVRKAAVDAAKAVKAGDHAKAASIREKAVQAAEKARKDVEAAHKGKTKGLQVGVRIPVSNVEVRATVPGTVKAAKILNRDGKGVATRVRNSRAVQHVAPQIAPDFRKTGEDVASHRDRRHAQRRLRSDARRGEAQAHHVEQSITKAINKADRHARVSKKVRREHGEQTIAAVERAPVHVPAGVKSKRMRTPVGEQAVAHAEAVARKAKVSAEAADRRLKRELNRVGGSNPARVHTAKLAKDNADRAAKAARDDLAKARKTHPKDHTLMLGGKRYSTVRKKLAKVQDANTVDPKLTKYVRQFAEDTHKAETAAGVKVGKTPDYYAHQRAIDIEHDTRAEFRQNTGNDVPKNRGSRKYGPGEKRKMEGTQREIEQRLQEQGRDPLFSNDVSAGVAHRKLVSTQRIAKARYVDSVVGSGKRYVKHGVVVPDGHSVYERTNTDRLVPVSDNKLTKLKKTKLGKKKLFILNDTTVAEANKALEGAGKSPGVYNKLVGKWKGAYTVFNPSYHTGNFIGNRVQEFEADATMKNHWKAKQVNKLLKDRDKFEKSVAAAHGTKFEDTLKPRMVRGKKMTVAEQRDLLHQGQEAEAHGGIGSGLHHEVTSLQGKEPGRLRTRIERAESKPRLATYLSARDRGLTPHEAGQWVADHHVDYGDLTDFEKKVREVGIPFYTFTARNARLQVKKAFQRPGKLAAFQHARVESADEAGEDPEFAKKLKRYQQAGTPFVLNIGGHALLLYGRTPIDQGLGLIPSSPNEAVRQLINRVGPVKIPIEMALDYNSFMRSKIDERPLQPAPQLVGKFPKELQKLLGVEKTADGKYMWRSSTDYLIKQAGPFVKPTLDLTTGPDQKNRFGQKPWQSVVSALGIKLTDAEPAQMQLNQVNGELAKTLRAIDKVQQLGKTRNPDPKYDTMMSKTYARLVDRKKALLDQRQKLSGKKAAPRLQHPPSSVEKQVQKKVQDAIKGTTPQAINDRIKRKVQQIQYQAEHPNG